MFSRMRRSFKDQVELAQICDGTECGDRVLLRNAMTDFPGLSPEKNRVCWYVVWVFFPMRLSPKVKNFSSWMPWRDLFSVMKRMDLHCMKPSSSFYGIKPIQRYFTESGNFIVLLCSVIRKLNYWVVSLFYMASVTVETNCCCLSVLLFSIQNLPGLSGSDLVQGFSWGWTFLSHLHHSRYGCWRNCNALGFQQWTHFVV